jgi:putative lipoprotein (rSAM/lipoprotein system)
MKMRINKLFRAVSALVMGILGFGSCEKISDIIDGNGNYLCMYGQPHAEYKVIGSAKSDSGEPIQGIRVIFRPQGEKNTYLNDTTYTDSKGAFIIGRTKNDFPDTKRADLLFEDVDGENNGGEFANATYKVYQTDITQTSKGDGAWDFGAFTIKVDATMRKK